MIRSGVRLLLVLGLGGVGAGDVRAQSVDTAAVAPVQLPSVEIIPLDRPWSAAESRARLRESGDLRSGALPDVQEALNRLPGVKMESRGIGGSRRISIRGSNARSPFAIRNTFLLVDGFVLTSADGVSPFEWLDPQLLSQIEVVAGPTGAFVGGGYGGVLAASMRPDCDLRFGTAVSTVGRGAAGAGPAGTVHAAVALPSSFPAVVRLSAAHSPGYRDQEANRKVHLDFHGTLPSNRGRQRVWVAGWLGMWELPGALDAAAAAASPTAAPGAPFGARVERDRLLAGWSREVDGVSGVWLLAHGSTKRNPFGTSRFYQGDKHESEGGFTGRVRRTHVLLMRRSGLLQSDFSAIVRADRLHVTEWDTLAPPADRELRYTLRTDALNLWAGAGLEWVGVRGLRGSIGVGAERLDRLTTGDFATAEVPYREPYAGFRPLLRGSARVPVGPRMHLHASFAQGIGHPASLELVHPETFLPNSLRSERADGAEAGVAATWRQLFASAVVYHTRVVDAIRQVPGSTDAAVLENAEAAALSGCEIEATWTFPQVQLRGYGALQDHRVFAAETLSLPGSPATTVGLDARLQKGRWTAEAHVRRTGSTPLNDANTDVAAPWTRCDAELARAWGPWSISAGVRNAFDVRYTDWWSVNAPAGRYYNPAAPRTWFIACTFSR